ncbi:MAG: HNH endonuclease [Lachnospiraceae bacterium]|nr:HNH endonuclease [Lachnospiraceae bacterium]
MSFRSFSWEIVDDRTAIKHCDKSFFEHHGTGIPKETRAFWGIEDLEKTRRKDVTIVYEGNEYSGYFAYEPTGRTRMFWYVDLQSELSLYKGLNSNICAEYTKINEDTLYLEMYISVENPEKNSEVNETSGPQETSLLADEKLRQQAKAHETSQIKTKEVVTEQKSRDSKIAEYAKRRANGICQLCGQPAPFKDEKGRPYLESHHIDWLANGGSDTIENTVALCPNCHRKMHILKYAEDIAKLRERAKEK